MWNEEFSIQQILVNQQSFEYKDKTISIQSPLNQQFELKLLHNLGLKRHFEWFSSFGDTEILNDIDFSKNRQLSEKTSLLSRDFILINKFDLSQKYKQHLFQLIGHWSSNSVPQAFSPLQKFSFSNAPNTFANYQSSHFYKRNSFYKLNWLRKFSKFRTNFQIGFLSNQLKYRSFLLENEQLVNDFVNDNQYKKFLFSQSAILNYDHKKWKLSIDLTANHLKQNFEENFLNEYLSKESNYLNIQLDVFNDFTSDMKMMLNWKMDQKPIVENYLFINQVVHQNRGTVQNRVSLDLAQNNQLSLGLRKDNLSNGINQNLMFSFMNAKNAIISNLSINENYTKVLYVRSPQNIQVLIGAL
jgi:hypothetical protein